MSALARFAMAATALSGLAYALPALGQTDPASYARLTTIQIPPQASNTAGTLTSFDISFVNQKTETYFLADRSNASLDVFDAHNATYIGSVTSGVNGAHYVGIVRGSTGAVNNDASGPNGAFSVGNSEVWTGDGDSTVKIVNLNSFTITDVISTGGTLRADEGAYDPVDGEVEIANPAEPVPFITFISTSPGHPILAKLSFPDAAVGGIEQGVYDRATGLFYVNFPQICSGTDASTCPQTGAVRVIDPKTFTVVAELPDSDCSANGLALGPKQRLLLGCNLNGTSGFSPNSQILRASDGGLVNVVRKVGGSDEVWYNSGNKLYFLAASSMTTGSGSSVTTTPVLGIIDAVTNKFVMNIPTTPSSHSVAADSHNNYVFVPLTPTSDPACPKGCIGVYSPGGTTASTQIASQ